MTVPALDTSFIGTLAYLQPATSVQIADVLPYLHSYQQYSEYVDGVMRIYDTGGASGHYCDCYVRVRTDGWMMAFFPDDTHQGTACWGSYSWILDDYNNRGDLVWWGHAHTAVGNPTANSTRLGRALSEMWTQLKANSNNPTYTFDYADVGYYDYEHISSTKIYIFGACTSINGNQTDEQEYFFTVPVGTSIQSVYINWGYYLKGSNWSNQHTYGQFHINEATAKAHTYLDEDITTQSLVKQSLGYVSIDPTSYLYTGGVQNKLRVYSRGTYINCVSRINTALVLFGSG